MKSVDTQLLPVEAPATPAADALDKDARAIPTQKGARRQGEAFDAVLAKLSEPDAAAAKRTDTAPSKAAPLGSAPQGAVALTLPSQNRSIHESITRTTRNITGTADSQTGLLLQTQLAPGVPGEPAAMTPGKRGGLQVEADDALSGLEPEDSVDTDHREALQAVLGQVVSAVARIVAPAADAPVESNSAARSAPRAVPAVGASSSVQG
ncbi:MAG: hypothetical protein JWN48_4650, partial [Myxococcaceae bacterium]|nr:hypothetical protein [Myxococcaceae bacterium]